MGKIMTLRGTMPPTADNARSQNNQIFSFEANVLEKGWIVKEFYFWPATVRAATGTVEGQYQVTAMLQTDDMGNLGIPNIGKCSDNRSIAWMQKGYNLRDASVGDFIASPTGNYFDNKAIIDPDHVVNDALYISFFTTSDSTVSPERLWNYMVILEEIKLTPAKAILSLLKGKGQDLEN